MNWEFIKKNGWNIGAILIVLLGAFLFLKKNFFHPKAETARNLIAIQETFDKSRKNELPSKEMLELIQTTLKQTPSLHGHYDAPLALVYQALGKSEETFETAQLLLDRNRDILPSSYRRYGEISLLITKGKYAEALQQTQELQSELKEESSLLSCFNLLRLISLARATGETSLIEENWSALKAHPAFPQLAPLLKEGEASFSMLLQSPQV
jgi:tetratricopeptide (TPR) repeat protein